MDTGAYFHVVNVADKWNLPPDTTQYLSLELLKSYTHEIYKPIYP
jgi:hypothetical protein